LRNLANRWVFATGLACVAVAITGCQSAEPGGPTGAPPAPAPPAATHTAEAPTATAAPPDEESPQQWTMPNLVGSVLQDAQDQIQATTGGKVIITTSHDATGQGRTQVLDSNWKVCSQSIAAGQPITRRSKIDFAAVKLSESCP
jgi:hypothetical protein